LKNNNDETPITDSAYLKEVERLRELMKDDPEGVMPELAETLHGLADGYLEDEIYDEAVKSYAEALLLYRRLSDIDPVEFTEDTATALQSIGDAKRALEDFAGAEDAYMEALGIFRALAEEDHDFTFDIGSVLTSLGYLFEDTGRIKEAARNYSDAAKAFRDVEDAPGLAEALYNLANIQRLFSDRHKEAEKNYEEALVIYRSIAEEDPDGLSDLGVVLESYGHLQRARRKFDAAEKAYTEALGIFKSVAGGDDAFTLDCLVTGRNIGELYYEAGRKQDAERVYAENIAQCRIEAGRDPEGYEPELGALLFNQGFLYADTGRPTESVDILSEALEIFKALAATDGLFLQDVATASFALGEVYRDTKKNDEARKSFNDAAEYGRKAVEHDPDDEVAAGVVAEVKNELKRLGK